MIKVDNLNFSYKGKKVLENIDFNIKKGEFFSIAGANGAGKSTLTKLIGRILKPQAGEICLNEKNIRLIKPKSFAKIVSIVPQFPSYDFIRVEEFVALGRIPHFSNLQLFGKRQDTEAIKEAMMLCGVYKFKDKYINQISGGERQLVFISRALATRPQMLILDEPLSNLDIKHQEQILTLLKDMIYKNKMTVAAVLHDLNVISEFSDEVLLLKKGRIIACGLPKDVLTKENIEFAYDTRDTEVFLNHITKRPTVLIINH